MTAPPEGRSGRWRPGPGLLVTAAFIGPGTVATASRAGGQYGLTLLWTLILSVVAAIVLQEMAARLGVVGGMGLAEAVRASIAQPVARRLAMGLILLAIVFGNTAYQTGNLTGAALGAELLFGAPAGPTAAALGVAVAALLALGASPTRLAAVLGAAVLAMSAAFVATASLVAGSAARAAAAGPWVALPSGAELTAIALFGTTVVPYNLFLHAAAARDRWPRSAARSPAQARRAVSTARWDTAAAISLGGLVTAAIVVTAAAAFAGGEQAIDNTRLASQLRPLLGRTGEALIAFGLLAAGLTSAITAPLAAGYTARGVFPGAGEGVARGVAAAVALVGGALAARLGKSPQQAIVTAQAANGLLLPLVACFLLWVMNRADLLGEHRNGWLSNLAGAAVVGAAVALGGLSLWRLVAG